MFNFIRALVKPPFYPTRPPLPHEAAQGGGGARLRRAAGGVPWTPVFAKEKAMWPTMSLEEFLANPLAAIREIAASEKIYFITENGEPILDVRPWRSGPDEKLRGSVLYCGDVVTPAEDPFRQAE
ncbi:hypothetical protein GJ699_25725 [Duganella sp. FT80W]|uniref:Type II toxin-antitoxin system Phd/YefM family antitoxin n=1 Tax=Duganella guangzhouensis TaxID=2666084 RepID=A0A6I2L973_9BURK|nr:hypothetical protein [Duganella guangzhouensis]MRW93394.1 hypothetical protein [Duganella guangzhouensis]